MTSNQDLHSDPNDDFQQILLQIQQAEQAKQEQSKQKLRTEILPAFHALKVANIEAAYSGSGDSGAIDGVQFQDSQGIRVERSTIPGPLKESLEVILYELLPAGFEINDGGQGTLTVDVEKGRLTLDHQENYTSTLDSTVEWEV
jgi:hypothetical protein